MPAANLALGLMALLLAVACEQNVRLFATQSNHPT